MTTYTLPDLPYDEAALEPHLSGRQMALHHGKHHATYVKGANETLEKLAGASGPAVVGLEQTLAFNVSGHVLHSLFWTSMSPRGGGRPDGELASAIDDTFGSFERFAELFNSTMTTVQGSGWAVLAWEPTAARLMVAQLHDHQSNMLAGSTPILAADAWEHAYYLDYQNDKTAWAKAFFAVADWASAAERFSTVRTLAGSGRRR